MERFWKPKYAGSVVEKVFNMIAPDGKRYSFTQYFGVSKYTRHQGEKEKVRRRKQMEGANGR